MLLLILQRYYFESESQHIRCISSAPIGCCLSYKDTILKANHSSAVSNCSGLLLLLILQRYYFESESQLFWYILLQLAAVAYPTKILFWKRITAIDWYAKSAKALLLILQRYYFESESQLVVHAHSHLIAVAYPTKILFWKRITALVNQTIIIMTLLLILQRYYFESESQLSLIEIRFPKRCCLSYITSISPPNPQYHPFSLLTNWREKPHFLFRTLFSLQSLNSTYLFYLFPNLRQILLHPFRILRTNNFQQVF